ncbi:hypothetical protein Agabi119p4_10359 [Agaricus bisporus var. burnettii]|uniref:Uncharacterized protein n=1 Tax=Agaricus bisporus var. burnettii TaxID=192524 RepID=A0A8H7C2U2_AGABI|nr:hypothetical protein Agabi119p4_10359 [Agaricus bisporus var. burnettii]
MKKIQMTQSQQAPWLVYNKNRQDDNISTKGQAVDENHRVLHQFLHKEGPHLWVSSEFIVAWLTEAQMKTGSFYLRRLIGTRPTEEHDEKAVRHHRSVNHGSLENYVRLVAGLISFIHRNITTPKSGYKVPIPSEIETQCKTLISSIEPAAARNGVDIAEELIVETPHLYDSDNDSELNDDKSFGAHLHVEKGKSSLTNHENLMNLLYSLQGGTITHTIAAILFTGRLVFSWRINEAYESVELYFNERTESILPTLYLLKRGFSSLHSAEESSFLFNALDLSGRSAIIEGKELSMDQIGASHARAIQEITQAIDELTFYQPDYQLDENEKIYDEPRERRPGYSFVTDTRNP